MRAVKLTSVLVLRRAKQVDASSPGRLTLFPNCVIRRKRQQLSESKMASTHFFVANKTNLLSFLNLMES